MLNMPSVATNGGSLNEAVEPAQHQSGQHTGHDRTKRRELQHDAKGFQHEPVFQQARRHRARQAQHRADGKINAARQNDQRHADGETEVHRDLQQDVPLVGDGEKLVREQRHRDDHHEKRDERLEFFEVFGF